jgi:hypothetical protein
MPMCLSFEHEVPAYKRLLIPLRILDALQAKEGEYVYLQVNGWRHPAVLCQRSVSIPVILREKIVGNHVAEFSVQKIQGKSIFFLGRVKLHKKHHYHFDLHIHKCVERTKVMEVEIEGKKFLGSLERDRITVGPRVLAKLGLQVGRIYQVCVKPTQMSNANNSLLNRRTEASEGVYLRGSNSA